MLRKEDFPKEPIEILKDVLPSLIRNVSAAWLKPMD